MKTLIISLRDYHVIDKSFLSGFGELIIIDCLNSSKYSVEHNDHYDILLLKVNVSFKEAVGIALFKSIGDKVYVVYEGDQFSHIMNKRTDRSEEEFLLFLRPRKKGLHSILYWIFSKSFGVKLQNLFPVGFVASRSLLNRTFEGEYRLFGPAEKLKRNAMISDVFEVGEAPVSFKLLMRTKEWLSNMFAFSARPLRIASTLLLTAGLFSLCYSGYIVVVFALGKVRLDGWTSLSLQLNLLTFFLSLSLFFLTEYLVYVRKVESIPRVLSESFKKRSHALNNIEEQ